MSPAVFPSVTIWALTALTARWPNSTSPQQSGQSGWAVNYNRLHSDGYRENNQYDREAFTILGKIDGPSEDQFSLIANYTRLKAFIPSSLNEDDYINEPTKAAFTWNQVKGFEDNEKLLFGLGYQHDFLANTAHELKLNTSFFSTFRSNYESRPFNILRENSFALGARFRLDYQNLQKPNPPRFSIGLESFREQYDWQTFETKGGIQDTLLSDNQELRTYYNAFAEIQIDLAEAWTLVGGLNLNETNYDLSDLYLRDGDLSGDYSFASILSPRLGLRYAIQPNVALFATVSHGFSPPTLEETLAPEGGINPEIQPEKGWNFELGSRGRNLQGFSYELTIFTMRVQDLLVAQRTALDQYVGVNAGKTTHNGLEAYAQYQLFDTDRYRLDLFAGYTYSDYRFEDFVDEEEDYSGNELTGTAPHVLNAGLDLYPEENGFYGHLNFRFVDAMPLRDDNSIYSESYTVSNAKFGYRHTLGKWGIDIYGGINNLFDEKYASMFLINAGSFGGQAPRYYYPGLPRNYYGGIGLRYRL
jgi:iron complex outermembrane receptor protein